MRAHATWEGGFRTRLDDARGHSVTVDLPEDEGGSDQGTSSLELSVLSLAGCISTILVLVARKRRVPLDAIEVDLVAERPRGAPTVSEVHGTVSITSSAAPADVRTALAITMRTCPVGVLLEKAHIPVRVEAVISAPTTAPSVGSEPPAALASSSR